MFNYNFKEQNIFGTVIMSLLILSTILITSCGDDDVSLPDPVIPEADFSFSASDLVVSFTDASTNAEVYAWDFGVSGVDTDVSTVASPSFTYPEEGSFTVTLVVTSSTGDTDTQTMSVEVSEGVTSVMPVASFTSEVSDLTVAFTDGSTNAESYAWDFGVDGVDTDVSTDASPSFTYSEGGTFTVTLVVTSTTGDTDTATEEITVSEPVTAITPVAAFTASVTDQTATFTNTTTFTGASTEDADATYAWDFGVDGVDTDVSTDASPSFTYSDAGTFTVTLVVTSSTGDTDMTSEMVTISDGGGTTSNQFANITDDFDGDTGELRLDIDDTFDGAPGAIAVGRVTFSVRKNQTSTLNGFVNISGSSTTRRNALIDMRLGEGNGFEFTETGESLNTNEDITFPDLVLNEWISYEIIWDATDANDTDTTPLVTVIINGTTVTPEGFRSEVVEAAESSIRPAVSEGVQTVQFRFGGGSDVDETNASFQVDGLRIYSSDSGTEEMIFEDDYERYTVGESLDPDEANAAAGTVYRNNSFQVVIAEDE